MATIHMMCGLPGSGKFNKAKEIVKKHNAVYLSNDEIRKELHRDENIQKDQSYIFEIMSRRVKETLKKGIDVVYDATNTSRKKRAYFIKKHGKGHDIIGHVMITPYEICIKRDSERERAVGESVIKERLKTFQFPLKNEGFSSVNYYVECLDFDFKNELEQVVMSNPTYDVLFSYLRTMPVFNDIWDLPQDSTYHSFSVSRHTYHVYKGIFQGYTGKNQLAMLYAALFHDSGKAMCKSFLNDNNEENRYASFIGHENVSAYVAYLYLLSLGYSEDFALHVSEIVSLHMVPKRDSSKGVYEAQQLLTEERYEQLLVFDKYDNLAK